MFGTKEDMKQHAAERIEDLKSRGFEQAGIYDPAGVGGTHVMYVLHHADQPALYSGLAENPRISPDGETLEGGGEAARALRHARDRGGRLPALHRHRTQ